MMESRVEGRLKMDIVNKIKSLSKRRQSYSADNLLLEKNGEVVRNVNIRYDKNRKWPGRIVANNLKVTDYDSFCLLYELENSWTRVTGIIVKKTLLGRIMFRAVRGQSLL